MKHMGVPPSVETNLPVFAFVLNATCTLVTKEFVIINKLCSVKFL